MLRIDVGVMPQTRPDEISDGVSLSDKERRFVRAFVAEQSALDTFLPVVTVDGSSPNKDGVSVNCSQDDLFAWTDKEIVRSL
jgi:hypothetical protein